MATFVVNGGKPLSGTYPVSGAKNAAPKLLIASLLSNERCVFHNIPRFSDTFRIIDAIAALGGAARFVDRNTVEVQFFETEPPREVQSQDIEVPPECQSARQSVLFIGGSLARFGRVKIYPPKGDAIGKRPLNRHLDGIRALGGTVKDFGNCMVLAMPQRPKSVAYRFQKKTHCGTENLILASVFNRGTVTLQNCALEPEVDNLIECLNQMGANVARKEHGTIVIKGVKPFLKGCEITSIFDRLEAATALTLSVMTGGNVVVQNAPRELIEEYAKFLEDVGVELLWKGSTVRVVGIKKPLRPATIVTGWHPGFMTDWQPLATLLLAYLAKGVSVIHERIYENRWRYLEELKKMGVRYEMFEPEGVSAEWYNFNNSEYQKNEPHAVRVWGPTKLKSAELQSHDVRAGIDMLLAAIAAKGKSIIRDPAGHIDRGYENIVKKLTALGADIRIIG